MIKIRVEQKEIEADAGSDRLACWQEGAVGVDENTNRIVAQMAEMGYDENIVRSAVESLTRKGNHQPDIWSVCDEIEGKKNESTREHRTVGKSNFVLSSESVQKSDMKVIDNIKLLLICITILNFYLEYVMS